MISAWGACGGLRVADLYFEISLYTYVYMTYICPLRSLAPLHWDSFSKVPYICMFITIYIIIIIILDAYFDEDSDSDLRLEIRAHLDLVFEGYQPFGRVWCFLTARMRKSQVLWALFYFPTSWAKQTERQFLHFGDPWGCSNCHGGIGAGRPGPGELQQTRF